MNKFFLLITGWVMIWAVMAGAQEKFEMDIISTSAGDLKITFIGHGAVIFTFGGKLS